METVEWPLKNPDAFKRIGIRPPTGVLLYGPPGSGKTLLAKAVANESNANFISIRGPELLSKFVGESEKHVRDVFRRAKQVSPAIIFFDEIDALAPKRGLEVGTRVTENVVSQILTEISGLEEMHNVIVIAATNRPDILDSALLRPGRFDRQLLVPAPDENARLDIFKIHTKNMPLTKDINLERLAKETEGYTGADIEALCREAGLNALRENINSKIVAKKHFDHALKKSKPSIDTKIVDLYNRMDAKFKRPEIEGKEEVDYVG
jgi:transitional endoplasmic reticulum ATPase